jgi:glucose/arabinose dehydrogenase
VQEDRAAVWEVDRATGLKRIYASGLCDPTGLAFEPLMSKLWAVVNERDEIGLDLVPDYLASVKENAFTAGLKLCRPACGRARLATAT